eukprot:3368460-Rhodomonas_salina.1
MCGTLCGNSWDTEKQVKAHQGGQKSTCKWAGFKTSHFGNAEVRAEMGQAINCPAGGAGAE